MPADSFNYLRELLCYGANRYSNDLLAPRFALQTSSDLEKYFSMAKLKNDSKRSNDHAPCGRPRGPIQGHEKSVKESKALLSQLQELLDVYVEANELKNSSTRGKILETIVSCGKHFTSLELLRKLSDLFPEIGKATLYRSLPVFVASGILQEGPTDENGLVLYELFETDHHDHIVCLDCKQVFEFHDDSIEAQQARVVTQMKFKVAAHRHVVYAHCQYRKK